MAHEVGIGGDDYVCIGSAVQQTVTLHGNARLRQVRVVRDYGMYDRRENPQYYPEVARP